MTKYDMFVQWCNGECLESKTRDHHALDAIRRFEMYYKNHPPKLKTENKDGY